MAMCARVFWLRRSRAQRAPEAVRRTLQTKRGEDGKARMSTIEENTGTPSEVMFQPVNTDQDVVEIDLLEVLQAIWKRFWLVLVCAVLGAVIALGFTQFFITPMYTSTAKMLVLSKDTTISSLADLQIGSQLTNDYTILIRSRTVLERTIANLGLNMTDRQLRERLTINNPTSSRILEISVQDPDPERAFQIVEELSNVASDFIGESMEVTNPRIIEKGVVPTHKSSPNRTKNTAVGLLLGAALAIAIIVIQLMLNDAVTSEEDVNKYLNLPVLALLPQKDSAATDSSKKKKGLGSRVGKGVRHGRK